MASGFGRASLSGMLDPLTRLSQIFDPSTPEGLQALYGIVGGLGELRNTFQRDPRLRQSPGMVGMQALAHGNRMGRDMREEEREAEKLRREQAEEERRTRAQRAVLGPYAPETGGVPWTHPDTGRTVTGGLFDQMDLTPPQRATLGAQMLGADIPPQALKQMFPEPATPPTGYTTAPGGGYQLDPGYLAGEGALAEATRAPQQPPAGYKWGPNGELVLDPGYLTGQQQLSTATREPEKSLERIRAEAEARALGTTGVEAMAPPKPKTAINLQLPSGEIVTSLDGGVTYLGPNGQSTPTPANAIVLGRETGAEYARGVGQAQQAQTEAEKIQLPGAATPAKAAAEYGTGPFSRLAAAADAVAGGLEIDQIFGQEGFFPETQDNRQSLRILKQTGKAALLNSARGATWEQERIDALFPDPDKVWANPRTEARKITALRDTLLNERMFNLQAIATGSLAPEESAKFRANTFEIERTLALMGYSPEGTSMPGAAGSTPMSDDDALINKYLSR